MTKSELIELIASRQTQLSAKDVELAVKTIIEHMSQTLAAGERIEIRGSAADREIRTAFQAGKGAARARQSGAARGPVSMLIQAAAKSAPALHREHAPHACSRLRAGTSEPVRLAVSRHTSS